MPSELLDQKKAELTELREDNGERVKTINNLPVAPFSMTPQRMEAIIEFLMPMEIDGELNEERLDFEIRWENACSKFLDEVIEGARQHMARSKLAVASVVPPGDMTGPPQRIVLPGG
jgi:hypothetical protein